MQLLSVTAIIMCLAFIALYILLYTIFEVVIANFSFYFQLP